MFAYRTIILKNSKEKCIEAIKNETEVKEFIPFGYTKDPGSEFSYVGIIKENSFKIQKSYGVPVYHVMIYGDISIEKSQIKISIITMPSLTEVSMLLLFLISFVVSVFTKPLFDGSTIAFGLTYLILQSTYWINCRRELRKIEKVIQGIVS